MVKEETRSKMYKKGDYIVYGLNGPCLIKNVTKLAMAGVDDKRKYYVLNPVNAPKSTIYCPIDNEKVPIRDIMSKSEAQKLLREVPKIARVRIDNEKLREEQYKEIIKKGDFKKCVGLLKALHTKRQSRLDEGRKFTTVDEKYLREVEGMLCSEMAIALGEEREKTTKKLWDKIESKKKK